MFAPSCLDDISRRSDIESDCWPTFNPRTAPVDPWGDEPLLADGLQHENHHSHEQAQAPLALELGPGLGSDNAIGPVFPPDAAAMLEPDDDVQEDIRKHITTRDGVHHCRHCTYGTTFLGDMKAHYYHRHAAVKPFKCSFCGMRFARKNGRRLHVMTVHTNQRNYRCPHCEKTARVIDCSRNRQLGFDVVVKNENLRTDIVVYEVPPGSAPPSSYEDEHEQPHRGNATDSRHCLDLSVCDDPGSTEGVFSSTADSADAALTLEDYALMRDGLWCCLLCDYRNPRTRLIKRHLSSNHAGLRPFRCGCCHKTYVDKSGLVRHQLMAHREKPIRCPHCPARFSLPWLCRQHAKRVHPHEPDL
ncbi:zinc finger protein-like [Tropilaelaps mercedesae]|uniref:Zinc finger protein-like n=1 Tax=Tropilaelaps mercedesae TaxID=418985 RepID=A0A1V9X972_9ACAR|nr:zinc finger protein-like [Tropilaelaps mercedesae]